MCAYAYAYAKMILLVGCWLLAGGTSFSIFSPKLNNKFFFIYILCCTCSNIFDPLRFYIFVTLVNKPGITWELLRLVANL